MIRLLTLSIATVVPVLFRHSLRDTLIQRTKVLPVYIFTVEPMEITSPSTDSEISLALKSYGRLLLIHCESNVLAHEYKAIPVLMNILSTRGVLGQGACLDALIAIMLDSSANQAVDIFSFDLILTEVV